MLTLRILGKRVLHLINQQHVIHRFTAVTRLGADLLAVGDIIRHGIAIDLNSTCVFISFKNHYFTKNLDCFSHIVTLFTTTFQSFLINH